MIATSLGVQNAAYRLTCLLVFLEFGLVIPASHPYTPITVWACSSMAEQVPFKHLVGGSNPSRLTYVATHMRIAPIVVLGMQYPVSHAKLHHSLNDLRLFIVGHTIIQGQAYQPITDIIGYWATFTLLIVLTLT